MKKRRWIHDFRTSLRNMPLLRKFIVLFLIAWILPMFLSSMFIYRRTRDNLLESQLELALHGHEQVHTFLDYRLNRVYQTASIIGMDRGVNDILRREGIGYTEFEQLLYMSTLRMTLDRYHNIRTSEDDIRLYVPGDRIYSDEESLLFNLDRAEGSLWYQRSFYRWGWTTDCPPAFLDEPDIVSIVRPIRDLDQYNHMIGAVRIDLPLPEIEEYLRRANITPDCLTYLLSDDGHLIAASNEALHNELKLSADKMARLTQDDTFSSMSLDGATAWVKKSDVGHFDWQLISIVPQSQLILGVQPVQNQILIAFSLLFIVVVFLSIPGIQSITHRLRLLVRQMQEVQQGNLQAHLVSRSEDEVGQLVDNFNYMLDQIKDLLEQQYRMGQDLKSAELRALQSQVNPHFLYNTLEMINWLSDDQKPQKVKAAVQAMARFYRLSLSRGEDISTMAQELDLVQNYMTIQNMRFHDKIKLVLEVDDSILPCIVPKITLQPIVENAIQHGILEKDDKSGTIFIRGHLESNGQAVVTVEDDGLGMDDSQLQRLQNGQIVPSDGSSFGLSSIDQRLALYFSQKKGLTIESTAGKGTRVTLRFPATENTPGEGRSDHPQT